MAGKPIDIAGQRFGRLVAIAIDKEKSTVGRIFWHCVCDCGGSKSVIVSSLRRGATRSCGCLHYETATANGYRPKTHGLSHHRIYKIWTGMIERCENPNNDAYVRYGGRGIDVCSEWRDSFMRFYEWAIGSGYADGLTIDRVDNDKGYSSDNCRWATYREQANNMRTNLLLTHKGNTHTLSEWSEISGVKPSTIRKRVVELGWSIEDAIFINAKERIPLGKSGVKGVGISCNGKWKATTTSGGRQKYIGIYPTVAEAANAKAKYEFEVIGKPDGWPEINN